jgi:hypothetical protein
MCGRLIHRRFSLSASAAGASRLWVLSFGGAAQFKLLQVQPVIRDNCKFAICRYRLNMPMVCKNGSRARLSPPEYKQFCRPSNARSIEIFRGFGGDDCDKTDEFRPKKRFSESRTKFNRSRIAE